MKPRNRKTEIVEIRALETHHKKVSRKSKSRKNTEVYPAKKKGKKFK